MSCTLSSNRCSPWGRDSYRWVLYTVPQRTECSGHCYPPSKGSGRAVFMLPSSLSPFQSKWVEFPYFWSVCKMSLVNLVAASRSNWSWCLLNSPVVTIVHVLKPHMKSHFYGCFWAFLEGGLQRKQIILVQSAPCSGNRWEVVAVLTQNLQDLMCQVLRSCFCACKCAWVSDISNWRSQVQRVVVLWARGVRALPVEAARGDAEFRKHLGTCLSSAGLAVLLQETDRNLCLTGYIKYGQECSCN